MENAPRPIPGHAHYLASRDGTIWTAKRKGGNDRGAGRLGPPRKLKAFRRGTGYVVVALDLNGRVVTRQVHRLVLLTFVGEPKLGQHGCHYPDPNPSNNNLENLRWDSPSENARDKYRERWAQPTKTCTKCGLAKEKAGFYADRRNIDGLKGNCKNCHNQQAVATRDREKKNALNRDFMRRKRAENPAYCR